MNRGTRLVLVFATVALMTAGMTYTPAQVDYTATLTVMFPSLDTYAEAISNIMKSNWYDLFIDVKQFQLPEAIVLQNYFSEGNSKLWDIIIVQTKTDNKDFPEILNRYSNETRFGERVYNFANPDLLRQSGVDYDDLQRLVNEIHAEYNLTQRKILMDEFQKKMMQEWLIELPLFEQTQVYVVRDDFEQFDPEEGVLGSIMLGADWKNNPTSRTSKGFGTDLFQSFITNEIGSLNPILPSNIEVSEIQDYLFPTMFSIDKSGNLHPNLVKQYNFTRNNEGSVWDLYLYDNVFWRERDGQYINKVTTKDLRFTLDLKSKNWSQYADEMLWVDGFRYEVLSDYRIKLYFDDPSPVDESKIASLKILPEHILNGTLSYNDGSTAGELYRGGFDASNTKEWTDFALFPITSGPFYFSAKIERDYILKFDEKFHFPTEADSDNFAMNTAEVEKPYFFTYADDSTTSSFEKPSSLPITERRFLIVEQPTTTYLQFSSGIGDIVTFDNVKEFSGYRKLDRVSVIEFPVPGSGVMAILNLYNPILQDLRIRKALYYALDRALIKDITNLDQDLLDSNINSYYSNFYNDTWGYEYNFKKAAELFTEVGYPILGDGTRIGNAPFIFFQPALLLAVIGVWRKRK